VSVKGMRVVMMENEALRVSVLVDKGADIVEFVDKASGVDVLWRSPIGLRSIKDELSLMSHEQTHTGYYEGGWQEAFPHASQPLTIGDVREPMHGEVLTLPWKYAILEDRADTVTVKFWTHTVLTRFRLERVMRINATEPVVHFRETMINEGANAFDIIWGHHPAFGAPFLEEGCRIELPKGKLVDGEARMLELPGREARFHNMFYLTDFQEGYYGIRNGRTGLGFGMQWEAELFRVIWIWQKSDGDRYVCAVEPMTSFPAGHYDIVGRRRTEPGEVLETSFAAFLYRGALGETLKRLG